MKKGIFAQAWKEALQEHQVYKKKKLQEIAEIQQEFRGELDKKTTGILGGIGLYYLRRFTNFFKYIKNKGIKIIKR